MGNEKLREAVQAIVNRWDDDKNNYRGRAIILQLKAALAAEPPEQAKVFTATVTEAHGESCWAAVDGYGVIHFPRLEEGKVRIIVEHVAQPATEQPSASQEFASEELEEFDKWMRESKWWDKVHSNDAIWFARDAWLAAGKREGQHGR